MVSLQRLFHAHGQEAFSGRLSFESREAKIANFLKLVLFIDGQVARAPSELISKEGGIFL